MTNLILDKLAPKGFLRAGINLSNFLLVTGKKSNGDPEGVSPDMAKALADELGVDLKLIPFARPGELADAVSEDIWDIGNIAVEPERSKTINFSSPYALIESTYLVRSNLNINTSTDVDMEGIRYISCRKKCIGFKPGNPEVETFINNFINNSIKNGFVKKLFLKYDVFGKLSLPVK